jgi:thiamine monophosphate synthase
MPRIIVETEGLQREVVFWEHVGPEDFDAEHFRRCLADRIGWAVADAREAEREERFARDAPRVGS